MANALVAYLVRRRRCVGDDALRDVRSTAVAPTKGDRTCAACVLAQLNDAQILINPSADRAVMVEVISADDCRETFAWLVALRVSRQSWCARGFACTVAKHYLCVGQYLVNSTGRHRRRRRRRFLLDSRAKQLPR